MSLLKIIYKIRYLFSKGIEIDLTSIKSNDKYIPEVESHINNIVPHTVIQNYSSVLDENYFPDFISEKFKIIDKK